MFDGIAAWKARGLVEAWSLESPDGIADGPGGTIAYQRLRDQIKSKCTDLLRKLDNPRGGLLAGCLFVRLLVTGVLAARLCLLISCAASCASVGRCS